jgi:hypothetical protein
MESGGSFLQGYNCQLAVDEAHGIIVAQAVTNQCPDAGNLLPLLDLVQESCGASPEVVTADAGYWTPLLEMEGAKRGTELYVAPDRQRRGRETPETPDADPDAAEEPTAKEHMRPSSRPPRVARSTPDSRQRSSPSTARSRRPSASGDSSSAASLPSAANGRWCTPTTAS